MAGRADTAQAEAILKQLLQHRPEDLELLKALAACFHTSGSLEMFLDGGRTSAQKSFSDGLAAIRAIPSERRDVSARRLEVRLLDRFAIAILGGTRDDESIQYRLDAIALIKRMIVENPQDVRLQEDLGGIQHNLSDTMFRAGKFAEAAEQAQESVKIYQALRRQAPQVIAYIRRLSNAKTNYASALDGWGRWAEAEAEYRAAVDLLESHILSDPARMNTEFRHLCIVTFHEWATLLNRLRRPDEGLRHRTGRSDSSANSRHTADQAIPIGSVDDGTGAGLRCRREIRRKFDGVGKGKGPSGRRHT